MKNTGQLLLICLTFLLATSLSVNAQEGDKDCKSKSKTIKGTYNGKNLFIQNSGTNGIQTILIDNKEVATNFNTTTFELELVQLTVGQTFELEIIYCSNTAEPYKILNLEVIKLMKTN